MTVHDPSTSDSPWDDRDEPMPENAKRTKGGERILCAVEERAIQVALAALEDDKTFNGTNLVRAVVQGPAPAKRQMDVELEAAAEALDGVWKDWMRRLLANGAIRPDFEEEIQRIIDTAWVDHPEPARERARFFARRVMRLADDRAVPLRHLL